MKRSFLWLSGVLVVLMFFFAAAPAPASAAPLESAGGSGCGQFYTVRWGDTLYRIALRFGTSVRVLTRLNGLASPDRIITGQTLCVKPAAAPAGFWYTVQRGDTLRMIGQHFGWGVWYLAKVNHIANPDRIFAGQVLLIPFH